VVTRGEFRLPAEADPPRTRVEIEGPSRLPCISESRTREGTVPIHGGFSGLSEVRQAPRRATIIDPARGRFGRAND
jgi:hypothetical protein